MATASYTPTDQVSTWGSSSSVIDQASNITTDPASGLTLTWTARNQMGSATGASELYDGLGRREQSSGSGYNTLNFLHDGGSVLGWPTTTWVPLIDASGSKMTGNRYPDARGFGIRRGRPCSGVGCD